MTNEQIKVKELAKLLNAFAEGKQLEFLNDDGYWCDYQSTIKDIVEEFLYLDNVQIRIKPETKTRRIQLSREDILDRIKLGFEAMWITDNGKDYSLIVGISHDGVYRRTGFITFREMMQRYTFSFDGTPCYKEVEYE